MKWDQAGRPTRREMRVRRRNRSWVAGLGLMALLTACGGSGGGGGTSSGTGPAAGSSPALPVAGSFDSTFGIQGKVTAVFPNGLENAATAMAIQPDGKIILVGSTQNGSTYNFALARFNPDGSPDTSFDGDGVVETGIVADHDDFAYAVARQSDGKIVVAGSSVNASNQTVFALARYNGDGTLDVSFGPGGLPGIVRTSFGAGITSVAKAVAIQSDGKIVAAGTAYDGSFQDFALARYNSDGTPDTSFDLDGKLLTDFSGGGDAANAMAIQSDGKIVVVGQTYVTATFLDFAVARYNTDGGLDTGFNRTGKFTSRYGAFHDAYNAVAIQSDGKIVAAGYTRTGVWDDFAVTRFNSDGTLDTSFGGSGTGTAVTDIGGDTDLTNALAIQANGEIVAAGRTSGAGGAASDDMAIVRYRDDGTPDDTFNGNGKLVLDLSGNGDITTALAIQSDGKLVVAGSSFNGFDSDFVAVRLMP
jgi:uncharacterized delta-60 repeat protein